MDIPTICPQCGNPLQEKSGTSKKTGKPYSFVGCTGYPNCNYIYREPKKGGSEEVLEALRKLYARTVEAETKILEAIKVIHR